MKTTRIITLLFIGIVYCSDLKAQTAKITYPSDAPSGYTYDFNLAQQMIIERQVKPSSKNQLAQAIIDKKDFPLIGNKNDVSETYLETLKKWMEQNPSVIIDALKSNKEIVQQY